MKRHIRKAVLYVDPGVSIFTVLDAVERHGIRHRLSDIGDPDICDHVIITNPIRGVHWRRGTVGQNRRRLVVTVSAKYQEKEKRHDKGKGSAQKLYPSGENAAAGSPILREPGKTPGASD